MNNNRRKILKASAALITLPAITNTKASEKTKIIIIGGGFGGATAARYTKEYAPQAQITLIEPNEIFYTCPFSNLYLAGLIQFNEIGHNYEGLKKAGINIIHKKAHDINQEKKQITLSNGEKIKYDKLILSPGVEMKYSAIEGYSASAAEIAPHAWKAGEQTKILHRQLREMKDGGVFIMTIPQNPFRCPPGPYERAAMIAHYFKTHKPKSKILLLDAKDNFSKKALFIQGWRENYGNMIEWVGQTEDGEIQSLEISQNKKIVNTLFGTKHKADVLNVIPPQKAGKIAEVAGLTNASGWCEIHANTFQSKQNPDIYIIGDSTIAAPMPKSGFAANTQGKAVAAHIAAELAGIEPPAAAYANTCYSMITPTWGISVAGVYAAENQKIIEIQNSGGVSPINAGQAYRNAEAQNAKAWYQAISQDIWDR